MCVIASSYLMFLNVKKKKSKKTLTAILVSVCSCISEAEITALINIKAMKIMTVREHQYSACP